MALRGVLSGGRRSGRDHRAYPAATATKFRTRTRAVDRATGADLARDRSGGLAHAFARLLGRAGLGRTLPAHEADRRWLSRGGRAATRGARARGGRRGGS